MLYPDTIFMDGNLITLGAAQPTAQALATLHGRIAAVGANDAIAALKGARTHVVDLGGHTVIPGFHDAHCHILELGLTLTEADASGAASIGDILRVVGDFARRAAPGAWVRGSGYNQSKLAEARHPTRGDLDAVAPDHPVFLAHVSGHMAVLNSRALELAHITSATADPPGGVITRDLHGEPTGLLQETAQQLARQVMPRHTLAESKAALAAAGRHLVALGVTSAQDAWAGWMVPEEFRAYQDASLSQRVRLMPDVESLPVRDGRFDFGFGLHTGFGTDRLRLGAIKIFTDGSLIGRTAALSQPYADTSVPGSNATLAPHERSRSGGMGFLVKSEEKIREQVRMAHAGGWQVALHAIGDRAIEAALDAIEAAMGRDAARFRPRLEHCGVLRPDLLERIRTLGVVITTQPRFIYELGDGFREALGEERLSLCYPLANLRGLNIAFSSDAPVVDASPLLGIQAAVLERTASGAPYVPGEAISVYEGLNRYTLGAAYSAFEEREKGSLEVGKWADFAVLSDSPLEIPADELHKVEILRTVIGGETVFEI